MGDYKLNQTMDGLTITFGLELSLECLLFRNLLRRLSIKDFRSGPDALRIDTMEGKERREGEGTSLPPVLGGVGTKVSMVKLFGLSSKLFFPFFKRFI